MAFLKKQGVACYLNFIAAILGIAGIVALVVSSTTSNAYALSGLTLLVVAAIIGIALILVAIYMPNRRGNYDVVSTFSVIASIALFSFIFGKTLNERILLISGLFSYNSGNLVGWSVFYANAVAWVCFLLSIVLLIFALFMHSVKEQKQR